MKRVWVVVVLAVGAAVLSVAIVVFATRPRGGEPRRAPTPAAATVSAAPRPAVAGAVVTAGTSRVARVPSHRFRTPAVRRPVRTDRTESPWGNEAPLARTALDDPSNEPLGQAFRSAVLSGDLARMSTCRTRLLALGEAAVPLIKPLLFGQDPTVEAAAVQLLAQIGGSDALVLSIGRVLSSYRGGPTYPAYLTAFADHRSAGVADLLADVASRPEYRHSREWLLELLGALRGAMAVEAFARMAAHADENVAADGVTGLTLRQDPSDAMALGALLETGDDLVKSAAAYGLANVGSGDACLMLACEAEYSRMCLEALATVTSPYAQEELLAVAGSEATPSAVRCAAVRALASHAGARLESQLTAVGARTGDDAVQAAVREALRALADRARVESGPPTDPERGEWCL
jgi:HEAT repeat protein